MAGKRSSSIDSGLLSSDVFIKEETVLKSAYNSSTSENQGNNPSEMSRSTRSNTMPSNIKTRSSENITNRRSFHESQNLSQSQGHPKADSDSDPGIVPDVTKLLLGNRQQRRSGKSSPTYSIHINTLYVYQNPTMPVENPMYQQLPLDRREENPPSPCSKPGYQYVWPTQKQDETRQAAQHSDGYDSSRTRPPTSLSWSLSGRTSSDKQPGTQRNLPNVARHKVSGKAKLEEDTQFSFSLPTVAEGEEMEILIKGKSGKSRRYKLQPIQEQVPDADAYIMDTSSGDKVVVQGFTINDRDEAFSEAESCNFQDSSSTSTAVSGTPSGAAIDTTVGDCKITVNQTFQTMPPGETEADADMGRRIERRSSENDLFSRVPPPTIHHNKILAESSPAITHVPESYPPSHERFDMSRSVPNIAISAKIDTCYECRNQKRGMFSSKHKLPRSCTLEGFHHITDEHEVSFMKEILGHKGKLGNWFITPTTNQPGYNSCLYVQSKRDVTVFPVLINKKKKVFIDVSMKKSFACLCKLTEHYKSNHLPSVNINLGHPLPKDVFPDMNFGADSSGTLMEQYAGIKL